MGLFGKLKENLSHGGVNVSLQAPASASMKDPTIPVTVNITATEEQHTINNVSVELFKTPDNSAAGFNQTNNPSQYSIKESMGKANYEQPFVVMPGETKAVPLNIIMNVGAAINTQLPGGTPEGVAQVANALQKLQNVANYMGTQKYTYNIDASVSIEGISMGTGKSVPIQLLKPGEYGGAANWHL